MKSLRGIKRKITSINGLVIGRWYILYNLYNLDNLDNDKRLLFKYKECSGNDVFDSGCYVYCSERYDNYNGQTFNFSCNVYCVKASDEEVNKYFPE
jgi:hypothetical protein